MAPRHLVVANLISVRNWDFRETCLRHNLLGSDDTGERVVTTDTDTHEHTPEDEQTNNGDSLGRGRERLSEGSEDDDHELETIHPLTTDNISQDTEPNLTDDGTGRGSDLDGRIGGGGERAGLGLRVGEVDNAQHLHDQVDGEDVVGISEETNTSDYDGADVVPAEGGLVNLGESETAALVGVGDVCLVMMLEMYEEGAIGHHAVVQYRVDIRGEYDRRDNDGSTGAWGRTYIVVVEVVESGIAASGALSHDR